MPARPLCHVNLYRGFRGGERQTELLVRELAAMGVPQRAVVRRDQPLAARLADVPGLEVVAIGKPFALHAARLRGHYVHAHEAKAAHLARWANRLFGTPYAITRRLDNRPGDNPVTRTLYRRAAGVAVLSRAIGAVIEDYRPGLSVQVIPSAHAEFTADAREAAKLRRGWGGRFVVGHVGALDDGHKGQRILIDAARRLLAEDRGWRFVLIGDGCDAAALRAAASDLPEVAFPGQVENIGDYLAAFDAFAYPSRREGLGSSLLDAMAFGLPIAAAEVGGIPELVRHKEDGLLVPAGDERALARALRSMREDEVLRRRLARAGRLRAAEFSPAAMAERYLDWYRQLGWKPDKAAHGPSL